MTLVGRDSTRITDENWGFSACPAVEVSLAGVEASWIIIPVEEQAIAQGNWVWAAAVAASALAYRRFLHQPLADNAELTQRQGQA
jgi:hypothetical protein